MRYNKIRRMDISNGPGVRISLFTQGCHFRCKGCFNPETHDFNGGEVFDESTINKILDYCNYDYIAGLSILGGEPLHPYNRSYIYKLCTKFRKKYPDKTIWVWTGYEFELVEEFLKLCDIDVAICGQFEIDKSDPTLQYRGSSNQSIIFLKSM